MRESTTPINSLILRTASLYVFPLLLLLSVFLLLRGHNEPGGGFIGGLVAAIAFVLHAIAYDIESARKLLHAHPSSLIGSGLLIGAASGVIGLVAGDPFLTGIWIELNVPVVGATKLGSPLLFDFGVFLVVIGVTLTIVLTLAED